MRLAVLSDIHGNLPALEAVLADLERQQADQVIINGDMVNRGPSASSLLERIWNQDYQIILGNHDDLMRKWIDRDEDLPLSWFDDPFWYATAHTAKDLLEHGWIEQLRSLPMQFRLRLPGAPTLLITHGSPRHYREGYSSYLADEGLSEIIQMHPADILIGSHTHQPLLRYWGKHRIINTGAVGIPFNGDPYAQYLLLSLHKRNWVAEFRRVRYDREAALRDFEDNGYLEQGGLSAMIFREELRYSRSFLTPFWMWSEKQGLPQNWDTWRSYQREFAGRFVK